MKAAIAYDATEFIRASIHEVQKTLIEAVAIVVFVIFLFLGDVRATIVPLVTIPLSLVGVMLFMLLMGYSLNLLTLLAFVLAIGLVVDDAIVVVENIYRHIEEGMTPYDAAMPGAREIALPVIGMTMTLAAVYAPIGFVGGLSGALFKEFAFTLAGSVVVSGFIALTLSPMMCSRLLRPHRQEGGKRGARRMARRAVRTPAQALRAPAPPRARNRAGGAAVPVGRADAHRRLLCLHPARTRAGRGPGLPAHHGEDAAIGQSRLSGAGDEPAVQGVRQGRRKGPRLRHQRLGGRQRRAWPG